MKISVITVTLNAGSSVGRTVASFLEQSHPDKELIVVDGASTDDTLAVVDSFKAKSVRVYSEADGGLYQAMNKGLLLFDGDAAGFLNADDRYYDRDALARIAATLETTDIAYGDLDIVRGAHEPILFRAWRPGPYTPSRLALGWAPPHPTFYARRHVLRHVGEFNPKYSIAADYDFMLRALASGRFSVGYIPSVLIDFQLGGLSSRGLGVALRNNLDCLRARRAHLGSGLVDLGLFARPLEKLAQLRRIRGYYGP